MHNFCADHEKIREIMIRFGETMDIQGFHKVLEDIEGEGAIGRAVRDPREIKHLQTIDRFLKSIKKELEAEPDSQEKVNCLAAAKAAFQGIKLCIEMDV